MLHRILQSLWLGLILSQLNTVRIFTINKPIACICVWGHTKQGIMETWHDMRTEMELWHQQYSWLSQPLPFFAQYECAKFSCRSEQLFEIPIIHKNCVHEYWFDSVSFSMVHAAKWQARTLQNKSTIGEGPRQTAYVCLFLSVCLYLFYLFILISSFHWLLLSLKGVFLGLIL